MAFKITKNWGPGTRLIILRLNVPLVLHPFFDVVLKVNTSNITVGSNGMFAGGGFLGGLNALQLNDAMVMELGKDQQA